MKEVLQFLQKQGLCHYDYNKSNIQTVNIFFEVLADMEEYLLRSSNAYARLAEETIKNSQGEITDKSDTYDMKCLFYQILAENIEKII